jgi:hypothetical protein
MYADTILYVMQDITRPMVIPVLPMPHLLELLLLIALHVRPDIIARAAHQPEQHVHLEKPVPVPVMRPVIVLLTAARQLGHFFVIPKKQPMDVFIYLWTLIININY